MRISLFSFSILSSDLSSLAVLSTLMLLFSCLTGGQNFSVFFGQLWSEGKVGGRCFHGVFLYVFLDFRLWTGTRFAAFALAACGLSIFTFAFTFTFLFSTHAARAFNGRRRGLKT